MCRLHPYSTVLSVMFLLQIEATDYVQLETLTPVLREISETHSEEEITEQANDLLVVILTKTTVLSEKTKNPGTREQTEEKEGFHMYNDGSTGNAKDIDFDTAFQQLCDPLLPVRGHALMRLAVLLRSRDPKAVGKVETLVRTFQDSLVHEDTYIYLAAVEGLVAAADVRPDDVMPRLAQEFVACSGEGNGTSKSEGVMDKGEYKGIKRGKVFGRRWFFVDSSIISKLFSLDFQ